MIVIDASAVIELLLRTPNGKRVSRRLSDADSVLTAPHVIDLEVAQTLKKLAIRGEIDLQRIEVALADFLNLQIVRYPHCALLRRIWELRHNVSAYDAAYVALAEALDAPLLTCDRRLAAACGHRAKVETV